MTITSNSKLAESLKKIYASNRYAQIFLTHLSERQKNPKGWFTSLDQAYAVIAEVDGNVARTDVRDVLESLAALGCGRFVIGRRGKPSRIEWHVDAIAAGKVARGQAMEVPAANVHAEDELPADMMEVPYPLRDDLSITLRVPKNLSVREAERLAKFIESLPK
jgi:hypothetical protein